MAKRFKFLRLKDKKVVSESGGLVWKLGEWQHVDGKPELCEVGLHCSKTIYQAFSYVQGEVLAEVEVKGKSDKQDDKECYSDMRIVKMYKWQKKDSVALSIFAAELCLKEFEKVFPDDKRPREAIEAARKVLEHDTAANRKNASAARSAAWSAAESAARSAAWSAESAAWSAESAAWSAARSAAWSAAESAAWSAESAAWSAAEPAARSAARSAESAAWSALIKKIDKWFQEYIKELEEL